MKKISYELRFGRPPRVSHFRVFGCKCFILKQDNLDKFESRSSDGIFLGYASNSRAYRVLNLETNHVVETYEVTFDETMPMQLLSLSVQVRMSLVKASLWRRSRKMPIGVIPSRLHRLPLSSLR